ncbi:MAG TPA: tRNA pseudouridine(38-40) synthase TruA [Longimicrobiales bacterium]|nr:tRNA pseudouridine(38-40) synthase TruA [Longimicrobiales bacterium]
MSARMEADEHRVKLTLHYDGGGFAGWQVQREARTVQAELEAALLRLTGRATRVTGAGRTDAGVHATGQVVGVVVPERWTPQELRRALNAVLPRDVWVAEACAAAPGFHARYDAVARGYIYRIGTADSSRSPFVRRWCWPLAQTVPLDRLNDAAARFHGEHSFRAFAKAGQPHRGEYCTVHTAYWREASSSTVTFHVVANRFLHHMVRYMVGTMVEVGSGRRPAAHIDALLQNEPDVVTSRPAPAAGLYLTRVYYDTTQIATHEDWSTGNAADEILS